MRYYLETVSARQLSQSEGTDGRVSFPFPWPLTSYFKAVSVSGWLACPPSFSEGSRLEAGRVQWPLLPTLHSTGPGVDGAAARRHSTSRKVLSERD